MLDEAISAKLEDLRKMPFVGGLITPERVAGIRDSVLRSLITDGIGLSVTSRTSRWFDFASALSVSTDPGSAAAAFAKMDSANMESIVILHRPPRYLIAGLRPWGKR